MARLDRAVTIQISPPNGEESVGHPASVEHAEQRDNFRDLLRQLAEEHDRIIAAKAAEKAQEIARLRFRLLTQGRSKSNNRTSTLPAKPDVQPLLDRSARSATANISHPGQRRVQIADTIVADEHQAWTPVTPVSSLPASNPELPGSLPASERRDSEADASEAPHFESTEQSVDPRESEDLFELREEWTVKGNQTILATTRTALPAQQSITITQGGKVHLYQGFLRHFISYPGSRARVVWDVCGALLIFYDMVVIPLRVFDFPDSTFTTGMDWLAIIFWTLNMVASIMVGYHHHGVVVMVPSRIVIHYLRTWFCVDVVVVVPDWAFTVASTGDGAGQSVRLLRILRLVRTVRLLRIFKLRRLLAGLDDRVDSEYTSILLSILKMITLLLSINHIIACAWFMVAFLTEGTGHGETWVTSHRFQDSGWFYQYLTSFHWSITQFTPASMDVQPQNVVERLFAVAVVVFALVGFSYVVGSITGSLAQIRSMQEDASKQFWNVRRYLRHNHVPIELSIRIQKYLEHAWQKQTRQVRTSEIKLFSLLSEQLHNELQLSMSVPHLSVHPLFEHLRASYAATMSRMANTTISQKFLAPGDSLFYPGEAATHMYFVVQGRLQYLRVDPSGKENFEIVEKDEDWISEPVLWTPAWVHLGVLGAEIECDLLLIDAARFNAIISLNPAVYRIVRGYAKNFLAWINGQDYADLSDIVQGDLVSDTIESLIPALEEPSPACTPPNAQGRLID